MVKIPLHVGVLVASARESELGPAFNVVHFSYFLVTVILVHHGGHKFFFIISAGLVIQDSINVSDNALLRSSLNCF